MGCCFSVFSNYYWKGETKKYSEIKNSLNTGDLVLFSGSGFYSNVVKFSTCSNWSHIGVIIRCRHRNNSEGKKSTLYLLHSSLQVMKYPCIDIISGQEKSGPQLNRLIDVIRTYDCPIYIKKLTRYDPQTNEIIKKVIDPCDQLSCINQKNINEWIESVSNGTYESDLSELIRSVIKSPFCYNTQSSKLGEFCSELVAEYYLETGLLNTSISANKFTPQDFDKENLMLERSTLSDKIRVVM